MIFAIREGLRENLTVQKFPVSVSIGRDRPLARGASRQAHRIAIDFDREAGDNVRAPIGSKANPNRVMANFVGYVIEIFASEGRAGAMSWEHDVEVYRVLDGVLVALSDWSKAQGAITEIVSGRLMTTEELSGAGAETSTVSGYRLAVRVGRSVDRKEYDGSAQPTADIGSVTTATRVHLDDGTYEEVS
ncbi:MAG: hypothetical protein WCT23_08610 [Candidatus Neomarinimicrobiota bacterium]